ncbi:MAG: peptidoglycan DD-metalloendopeptidase family protein [Eubacteriales bacterium]
MNRCLNDDASRDKDKDGTKQKNGQAKASKGQPQPPVVHNSSVVQYRDYKLNNSVVSRQDAQQAQRDGTAILVSPARLSFTGQIKLFRRNGLSLFEAYYNAYYLAFFKKSKLPENRVIKDKYAGIAKHPKSWTKNYRTMYKTNNYDIALWIMGMLAFIIGVLSDCAGVFKRRMRAVPSRVGSLENTKVKAALFVSFFKKRAGTLAAVAAIAFTAFMIADLSSYDLEIQAIVDNKVLGYISDKDIFDKTVRLIEEDVSSVVGVAYKFDHDIQFRLVNSKKPDYLSQSEIFTTLYAMSEGNVASGYGLYIDGSLVGAATSGDEIEQALDTLLSEQQTEVSDDAKVEFMNDIQIIEKRFPKRVLMSKNELLDLLEEATHVDDGTQTLVLDAKLAEKALDEVEKTNAISREATEMQGMSVTEGVDMSNTYFIPEDETEEEPLQALTFKSVTEQSYTVKVDYQIIYKESDDYYEGTEVVAQYGVEGENYVTADVVYVDGNEVDRIVKDTQVIKLPVDKIVMRGTNPIPQPVPTGTFIRPTRGVDSDGFGMRILRGRKDYHWGKDIAAAKNTPVYASDGGTVVYAGWNGQHGKYIRIRHSNGIETSYSHLNSILVAYGDKVYQGQQIGKVGATGDSTGYHLHFEVHLNGVRVNPDKYLK